MPHDKPKQRAKSDDEQAEQSARPTDTHDVDHGDDESGRGGAQPTAQQIIGGRDGARSARVDVDEQDLKGVVGGAGAEADEEQQGQWTRQMRLALDRPAEADDAGGAEIQCRQDDLDAGLFQWEVAEVHSVVSHHWDSQLFGVMAEP